MEKAIQIAQIVLAVFLMFLILSQQRSTALGGAFGGDSAVYRSRRGVERLLYQLTIIFSLLYIASVIAFSLV